VNPGSLTFAGQPVGTASEPMTVTVSNSLPGGPLTIGSVALAGSNPGDFAISADGCTGASLAYNATCDVSVRFAPTEVGTRSATLVLSDNALDSPQSVPLTGAGAPSADLALSLGATPNPVKVGSKLTYTVTTKNFGPTSTTGVSVTDALPSTVQFLSESVTQGSCNPPAVGATGTLNCALGSMASSTSATITVVVKVTTLARSTITNTASASSSAFDPQSNNNSATVVTNVFGRH
jgi:uncharacterized repeat protein (TIGR01451 family)